MRRLVLLFLIGVAAVGCRSSNGDGPIRASGYVEATDVRVAPEVGGRVLETRVAEGDRVAAGAVIAVLSTDDTDLAIRRAQADRDQAVAQLRLLQAGARPEEIRQSAAQSAAVQSEVHAAESELAAAEADLKRFEALLEVNAGSRKQRDDAATRRDVAAARVKAAQESGRAAVEAFARVKAGARAEEVAAASARVAAAEAQIATLEKGVRDAQLTSPVAGVVTSRLIDAGEVIAARTPIAVITDLDRAWANVYVDEPIVPTLKLGETVVLVTDAGQRLDGTISFISPKAEFTPRNVQTAEERSRLVYRIKVSTDNTAGVLKPGMPVVAEIAPRPPAQ